MPNSHISLGNEPLRLRRSPLLVFLVATLALTLNQSGRFFGVNLSIADPVMILTLLLLLLEGRLRGSKRVFAFFTILSISTISTALVVTPVLFGIVPSPDSVLLDFAKLAISFLFFTVGFSVAASGMARHAVRWFAFGATAVALAGIVLPFLGIHVFDGTLYYNFTRFRGLMVDPNYYAVLSCAAVAFFLRDRSTHLLVRVFALGILFYSIVMTGSKTGTVALLVLLALLVFDFAMTRRHAVPLVAALFVIVGFVIALWDEIAALAYSLAQSYGAVLPQLYRISELFNDAVGAAAGGGSDRLNVWMRGVGVIETSPFVGVGIGSYQNVVESTAGVGTLAHNTYIQIAAEWGLPLAIIFIAWIAFLLVRTTTSRQSSHPEAILLRDIVVIFMIGSISLSLNNARMFWFFVGIIAFFVTRQSAAAKGGSPANFPEFNRRIQRA